jgi:uncharacterized protein YndB with AHSA1/START domain
MTTVKIEQFIQAPPEEVYRSFTNSTALRDWMCDVATAVAQPGGRLYMCWPGEYYTSGEYIQLEKDKSVSFSWFGRGEPRKTRVDVTLKVQKGGTLVKLAHREIGKGEKWELIEQTYAKEWKKALENLASVLGEGPDLRITRRPMLGIVLTDYDAKIAAKLGIPVAYGTRLSDVVNGMGAQKAGLQKDDVIIAMDGHELVAGTTLGSILAAKHTGDMVEVTFYRGTEKNTASMTLSGRPIPTIPASAAELADQVGQIYHQYEAQIEELVNSASEAQCSHKPAPAEWNAKEVLAHLIHSELGWQNYASEVIGGHEAAYDGFGGNVQARIDATLEVYPTKDDLLKELKAHDHESISMLAHIPDEFLAHKGRYWKLVYQANQNPYHLQAHIEQMKTAIQSVGA